jgi:phosphoglycolate phosphatase-like HAD superfamily hydrolase
MKSGRRNPEARRGLMIKAIVLDFDGVIVDSNALKRRVFFELFPLSAEIPPVIDRVLSRNRYSTRHDILREILQGLGISEREAEASVPDYAARYNEQVQRGILHLGVSAEVRATLAQLSHGYHLYVNSGTYAPAIAESIENLSIGHFFQKVYGRPPSKEDNLRDILTLEKALGCDIVVVGDGEEDYQSATALGCIFIGIANGFNDWGRRPIRLASSINQVPELLASIESTQVTS